MKIASKHIKFFLVGTLIISSLPTTFLPHDDTSSKTFSRILLKSMVKVTKKTTDQFSLAPLFALASKISSACIDHEIKIDPLPAITDALETLIPLTAGHAAQVCQHNALNKNKKNIFNALLLRDLLAKSVSSTCFVQEGSSYYSSLRTVRRVSTFFNPDVFIDPANYKKYFDLAQGISVFVGEQLALHALRPALKRVVGESEAKVLATWIVEDLIADHIETIVKKIPAAGSWAWEKTKKQKVVTA